MTELHGIVGAPYETPQVRKKIPAPFSRERIDLDSSTRVKRNWAKDTSVMHLKVGDTVAGFGVLHEVKQRMCYEDMDGNILVEKSEQLTALLDECDTLRVRWDVTLTNAIGDRRVYSGHDRVYAFVPEQVNP